MQRKRRNEHLPIDFSTVQSEVPKLLPLCILDISLLHQRVQRLVLIKAQSSSIVPSQIKQENMELTHTHKLGL